LSQSLHLQRAEFCQAVGERAAFQCRPGGHTVLSHPPRTPDDRLSSRGIAVWCHAIELGHLMRQLEERLAVKLLTSGQVVVDNLAET
jgi:hypothetical protein